MFKYDKNYRQTNKVLYKQIHNWVHKSNEVARRSDKLNLKNTSRKARKLQHKPPLIKSPA